MRFGDIVQVRNDALDTTLAVHTDNEITWTGTLFAIKPRLSCSVSACKKGAASKRTSYRVVPCNGQADEQIGETVLYCKPFALQVTSCTSDKQKESFSKFILRNCKILLDLNSKKMSDFEGILNFD